MDCFSPAGSLRKFLSCTSDAMDYGENLNSMEEAQHLDNIYLKWPHWNPTILANGP